jgi:hypothetical protein
MTTKKNENTKKQGPALIANTVRESNGKKYWTRIGAAWPHDDGQGFNLQLEALPLDGKIVLRTPKSDEATEGEGA